MVRSNPQKPALLNIRFETVLRETTWDNVFLNAFAATEPELMAPIPTHRTYEILGWEVWWEDGSYDYYGRDARPALMAEYQSRLSILGHE